MLLHGFTSCPQQFVTPGQQLHDRGYNVLIPRLPYHGQSDRMSTAPERLAAADIALGLGEQVTVVGLSGGGTMAAWIGQQRADVDKAVVIVPALGIAVLPPVLTTPVLNAIPRLPSFFPWWDGDLKDKAPGPRYSSPIYSSRAIVIGEVGARWGIAATCRTVAARSSGGTGSGQGCAGDSLLRVPQTDEQR